MAECVRLRIEPDGTVVTLSGSGIEEMLDLRTLGRITTERAGQIRFDEGTQTWAWYSVDGTMGEGGFRTRREAVAAEVAAMSRLL